MLDKREAVNDGLIATLSDGYIFREDTSSNEPWTNERHLDLVSLCQKPLTYQVLVFKSPTSELDRNKSTDTLNLYIADRMAEIHQVERVYSHYKANVFYTWIVIEERDREVQKAIYAREKQIIDRFPEMRFDFYIVYRSGADPESLISGVELVYDREKAIST